VDVWCDFRGFCCRYIYFKTVFQSAPEHATFIQKIEKFSAEGAHPPRQIPLPEGGTPPAPIPIGAYSDSTFAHSALNPWPPFQTPKYATRDVVSTMAVTHFVNYVHVFVQWT